MNGMEAKRVMYGSQGEAWIDGDYMAEVESVKASVSYTKVEVKMVKHLGKDFKIVGWEGKGTVKLHKVDSYFIKKYADAIRNGQQMPVTIISKVSDPDAVGEERVALKNVLFDGIDLANWEVGKIGEESLNFTFSDFEILDEA
jgi:hypothetical protein